MVAARLGLSLLPAGLVTFGLFHLMQSLVTVEAILRPERSSSQWIDIVKVMTTRKLEAPPAPPIRRLASNAPPPALPFPSPSPSRSLVDEGFSVRGRSASEGMGRAAAEEGSSPVSPDGEAIALVRVEPRYPADAMRRGREGRVLVEFTISPSGSVEAARVVAAEPPGIFDREAIAAVRQWKYEPRIVQGRAVPQPGMRTTISFRLGGGA